MKNVKILLLVVMAVFGSGNIWSLGASGGGGGVASVENGLYLASGVARLGGPLIENTTISKIDLFSFTLEGEATTRIRFSDIGFVPEIEFRQVTGLNPIDNSPTSWNTGKLSYQSGFLFDNKVTSATSVNNAVLNGNVPSLSLGTAIEQFDLMLSPGIVDFFTTENTFKFRESSRSAARVQFDFSDTDNGVTLSLFSSGGQVGHYLDDFGLYKITAPGDVRVGTAGVVFASTEIAEGKLYLWAKDQIPVTQANQPNSTIAFRLSEVSDQLLIYAKYSTGATKIGFISLL